MELYGQELDIELVDLLQEVISKKKRIANRTYVAESLDIIETTIDYYANKIDQLCTEHDQGKKDLSMEINNIDFYLKTLNREKSRVIIEVAHKYAEILTDYYISLEELTFMFGVNMQFVISRIKNDLNTVEVHKTIRQWVKRTNREIKNNKITAIHPLITVIQDYHIDYDKKILVSKTSLYEWIRTHFTTGEGYELTKDMITEIIKHRCLTVTATHEQYPFLCSLKTYKDYLNLTYDAQLYRRASKTFAMYNSHANKPLARFCIDSEFDRLVKLYEYKQKKGN